MTQHGHVCDQILHSEVTYAFLLLFRCHRGKGWPWIAWRPYQSQGADMAEEVRSIDEEVKLSSHTVIIGRGMTDTMRNGFE